jgi:hypothetical protein
MSESIHSSSLRTVCVTTRVDKNQARKGDSNGEDGHRYFGCMSFRPGFRASPVVSSYTAFLNKEVVVVRAETTTTIPLFRVLVSVPEDGDDKIGSSSMSGAGLILLYMR